MRTTTVFFAAMLLLPAMPRAQGLPGLDLSQLSGSAGETVDCVLEPSEQVTISSPIPGIIERIHVERGDRVAKGAPIAELKSSLEAAQVALRQARVRFAERKLARNEELYREDLISEHELDEVRTELQLAEMEMAEAKVVLAQKRITSPFAGLIVARHQSPGQYVISEPIVTLVETDTIHAEVMLPAAMLATVREGTVVTIEPEYPPGVRHQGSVSLIDPVVDSASGTFGIRVTLDNRDRRIYAGVHCKATFDVPATRTRR